MTQRISLAILLCTLLAACASDDGRGYGMSNVGARQSVLTAPPLDPNRKVAEQDCSQPVATDRGNLLCR
jgi:hypothetical protein